MKIILIVLTIILLSTKCKADLSEFNDTFRPPDPLTSYHFVDDDSYTGWNKFWLGTFVTGHAADLISTEIQLNKGGCSETNPWTGSDPSFGILLAGKIVLGGLIVWYVEKLIPVESRQTARNWWYGGFGTVAWAAAGWNMSQNCEP